MNKKLIRLTESDLHNLVKESVNTLLREHFGRYTFHCYIPNEGNHSMMIDKISEVNPYISKAAYWDISKGNNSSEAENLVAWGGEGGYWSNVLQDTTNERLKQYILSKKKEQS